MARRMDYIPRKDKEFFIWQGNLVDYATPRVAGWNIPPADFAVVTAERAIYEPLYLKAENKGLRTRADVIAHREERQKYEKILRDFVMVHLGRNNLVTEGDRRAMNLTVRDTEPSPHPAITDTPIVGLRTIGGGDLKAICRTTTDQNRPSMHRAANLIDYRYILLDVGVRPPTDMEDYPKRDISSRAKFIIRVGAQNEGKRFWAVFRWVNTARPKQEGPWTEAINITIA